MKLFNIVLIIILTLSSCVWDDPIVTKEITNDYYLRWVYDNSNQIIIRSSDDGKSGSIEVEETVFAVGYNDDFIIAKQHPNLEEYIGNRLFDNYIEGRGYLLENPSDTIYLAKDDKIYQKNGKWYHISNGWNPPDSLKPYKGKTIYHIIDMRKKGGKNYIFFEESEFLDKRRELGISKNLRFTLIDEDLE